MSNIHALKSKKRKFTRNEYLLNMLKLFKEHVGRDEEIEDLILITSLKDGRVMLIGQNLTSCDRYELRTLGLLELAKVHVIDAISDSYMEEYE